MKFTLPLIAAAGLVAGCAVPPHSHTTPVATTVDCAAGGSINAALAAGFTQITVNGVCDENVRIATDNVSLSAGGPGAGIAPSGGDFAVSLSGAANTAISGLALDGTNASSYVVSLRFSDLILSGGSLTGGKAAGLYASNTSSVNVQGVAISGNDTAMTIINNSYANVTGGTRIEQTKFIGIIASRTSSVTFGGGSAIDGVDNGVGVGVAASGYFLMREGATIANVNGPGVEVRGAAFGVQEGSITGVTGDAVYALGSASVILDRATITGNGGRGVRLDGSSGGEYRGSTITGNAGGPLSISPDSEFINAGGNTVGP